MTGSDAEDAVLTDRALKFYAGNAASGLFEDAPVNTDDRPLIEYLAPRTHRAVIAGRAQWLTVPERDRLYGDLISAMTPRGPASRQARRRAARSGARGQGLRRLARAARATTPRPGGAGRTSSPAPASMPAPPKARPGRSRRAAPRSATRPTEPGPRARLRAMVPRLRPEPVCGSRSSSPRPSRRPWPGRAADRRSGSSAPTARCRSAARPHWPCSRSRHRA